MRIRTEVDVQNDMRVFAARGRAYGRQQAALTAQAETADLATHVTAAVRSATAGLLADLRGQVTSAGLGRGLANAWRGQTFPQGEASLRPAGYVYSAAPGIHAGFSDATVIRAGGKGWSGKARSFLAIPTDNAPRIGSSGTRITPANWPERQFGALELAVIGGKLALIAPRLVKSFNATTGRFQGYRQVTAGRMKKQPDREQFLNIVMFWLVPQVRTRKRIDPDAAFAAAADRLGKALADI